MKKIKTRKLRLKRAFRLRLFLVLVLSVFVFLGTQIKVDAGMKDTTILKNRKNGIYAVATIDGVPRIFYLNMYFMDGILAYCIELGVDITSNIYNSTDNFSISYLNAEQIEYVRSVTYYGYEYKGHNDYLYYAAAQEIIWEYISGGDVYWVSELDVDGKRIDIDVYKNKILELIEKNAKGLDFEFDYEKSYRSGDFIFAKDKNDVLKDYEVVSTGSSMVSIEGDTLVIEVGDTVGVETIKLKRKNNYMYSSMLYYYGSSQKLISTGNYNDVEGSISFNVTGVKLKGQVQRGEINGLVSLQDSLEGAIYELYDDDNNLIGKYTSGVDGSFIIDGLKYGNYYFKQIKASKGYEINGDIINFKIDADEVVVNLKQKIITNNIVINKYYGSSGEYGYEEGIVFEVYSDDDYFSELITDANGRASITLPYGTYKLVQKNTTPGYSKVDDFIIEVIENQDDDVNYNLINELILVKVMINTFIEGDNTILKSPNIAYKIRKNDTGNYLSYEGNEFFYADLTGVVTVPVKMDYGDYTLEQVNVPDGVLLNAEKFSFNIDEKTKLDIIENELVFTINFYNKLVSGNVNIKTLKEVYYKSFNDYGYKNEIRENVDLELVANKDIVINGIVKHKAGDVVINVKSDNLGQALISNLYLGDYCLEDKETLKKRCFVIAGIDNKTSVVNVDLEFIDSVDKFNLRLINISDEDKFIKDSKFELIDIDGEVIYTGITNEQGIIDIRNILKGSYCIRQKSVSDKFYLLNDNACFSLEKDDVIKLVNERIINKTIKVPNTFQANNVKWYIILTMAIMLVSGYGIYKKNFNY